MPDDEFNEFAAACSDAFAECGLVFGLTEALLGTVTLSGILDQQQLDRSLVKAGEKGFRQCTFMVARSQFDPLDQFTPALTLPLRNSLVNQVLNFGAIKMRIEKCFEDEMNVTLMLDDAAK